MKILFMGTPDFAVPSLQILYENQYDIVGVVTATDKPAGRGKKISESPVKIAAKKLNLNVLQPSNLKSDEFYQQLEKLQPDIMIVVAFRMLPEKVWSFPKLGCVNLHASLLPDYRGAAPINWVLINGEKETGVTTFLIEKEIDTGKILLQEKVQIMEDWNAGDLHDVLMMKGAKLVLQTVKGIEMNDLTPIPQDISLFKHSAPKLTSDTGKILWSKKAQEIHNLVRGLSPYPAAWTKFQGLKLKILKTKLTELTSEFNTGTIFAENKQLFASCGDNSALELMEIQLEGKSKTKASDFINGHFQQQKQYLLL